MRSADETTDASGEVGGRCADVSAETHTTGGSAVATLFRASEPLETHLCLESRAPVTAVAGAGDWR